MNMDPALDEHGIPQEARPPRKWLAYLLTGICLASGIGQMYWAVSIASTQMVGDYHRWKHDNYVPLTPSLAAILVALVAVRVLFKEQDEYSKTETLVLYTALFLALALAGIGWLIIFLIEPNHGAGVLPDVVISPADTAEPFPAMNIAPSAAPHRPGQAAASSGKTRTRRSPLGRG
jgi:hypothetical protein